MSDPVFEIDNSASAHHRVTKAVGQLLSLARMGVAASDSSLDVDLCKDGYTHHFEVMAQIADGMFEDVEQLQDKATDRTAT